METDSGVRKTLLEAEALIQLGDSAHAEQQVAAAGALAKLNCIGARDALTALTESKTAAPEVKKAAVTALQSINSYVSIVNFFGTIFHGFSLGSILLISALGLAITFGLMGVINMAHGEMIAVGAYTTYVVENVFRDGLPLSPLGIPITLPGLHLSGWMFQTYFIFAIPLLVPGRCPRWVGARAFGDPVSLPPGIGIVARDLGCFAHHAAAIPSGFRSEQCASKLSILAPRQFHDQRRHFWV